MASPASPPQAPPGRGRRTRRVTGDDREQAILATAERLLDERSLHEISVDDLARGAGISRPTFYFYFASKEAVLLSLMDRIVAEANASLAAALERLADEPPPDRWRGGITAFYDTFRAHRAVARAAADALASSAEARTLWSRVIESWVQEATAAIEAERARGAAPAGVPARDLAIALTWMNERVLHATFAGQPPAIDEDRVLDALLAVWMAAIYASQPTFR
jgi:TetR/AcrR family transcriptional regulator, ethionamide resistance regulator